jgi:hypothetical protein
LGEISSFHSTAFELIESVWATSSFERPEATSSETRFSERPTGGRAADWRDRWRAKVDLSHFALQIA